MKKITKILSILLALVVIAACMVLPANAKSQGKIKYVVLGDSVAFGSYVNYDERFGDVLAQKLREANYDVSYVNYAVPKYSSKSIWYDLNEDTYAYDNNRFVAELDAYDFRKDIPYETFIGNIADSDVVVIHIGENDLAAAFYAMRGYDDYYQFYGNERNFPLLQNDINNHKVGWIYTNNSLKLEKIKAQYREELKEYLNKDVKRIREINPDAQIILCDMFNPYKAAADGIDYVKYLGYCIIEDMKSMLKPGSINEIMTKFAKLTNDWNSFVQLTSILLPALAGGDINSCGGFDISALHGTPEKLLYKFQYLRVEAEAVDLYKIADEVIPEVVEENNITVAEISKTELDKHMAADGAHPNNEGHAIMAGVIFDAINFSGLS